MHSLALQVWSLLFSSHRNICGWSWVPSTEYAQVTQPSALSGMEN